MEQITKLIEKFAGIVGVQVDRLWPQMVRVWWLQNLSDLLLTPVVVLILALVSNRLRLFAIGADDREGDWEVAQILSCIFAVIAGVAALVFTLVYVSSMGTMLATLWYPEATYVQSLLKAAKP